MRVTIHTAKGDPISVTAAQARAIVALASQCPTTLGDCITNHHDLDPHSYACGAASLGAVPVGGPAPAPQPHPAADQGDDAAERALATVVAEWQLKMSDEPLTVRILAAIKRGEVPGFFYGRMALNVAADRDYWKAKCEERERAVTLIDAKEREHHDQMIVENKRLRKILHDMHNAAAALAAEVGKP